MALNFVAQAAAPIASMQAFSAQMKMPKVLREGRLGSHRSSKWSRRGQLPESAGGMPSLRDKSLCETQGPNPNWDGIHLHGRQGFVAHASGTVAWDVKCKNTNYNVNKFVYTIIKSLSIKP